MRSIAQANSNTVPQGTLPRPWVSAFLLLLWLSVLWPRLLLFPVGPSNQSAVTIMTLALFFGSVALAFTNPLVAQHYHARSSSAVLVVLMFLLIIFSKYISAFSGLDSASSLNLLNNSLSYSMSFFVIGLVMFVDNRNEEAFVNTLLVAAVVASLLSIYEVLRQNSLTVEFRWIFNLGVVQSNAGENLLSNMYRGGLLRAKSTFSHPLVFGQFVAATMPLIFVAVPAGKRWRAIKVIALLGVLGIALLNSNTRSALACAVISLGSFWALGFLSSKNPRALFVVLVGGVALVVTFLIFGDDLLGLIGGRTAEEVSSSQVREVMLERAFFALESSPLFGYGEGRSVYVAGVFLPSGVLTIDSLYITYLLDNGYVGALLYASLFGSILLMGLRGLRSLEPGPALRLRGVIAMVFSLLFGQAVLSIADNMAFVYLGLAYTAAACLGYGRSGSGRAHFIDSHFHRGAV
jgi:O-antigen ligase